MIPVSERYGAWPVVSRKRDGRRGWALPIWIHNGTYFYTQLVVFEDGVVDCWDGLDLPLFRKKLGTGWIAADVPRGGSISVHGLGYATIDGTEPLFPIGELEPRVMEAVRSWNPELRGLIDLHGEATELRGKVRHAKLPILDGDPFPRDGGGAPVAGAQVPIVLADAGELRLTRWFVYADGRARLGPEGALVAFDDTVEQIASGRARTQLPDDRWVALDGLGRARLRDGYWGVELAERIKEQTDNLRALRTGENTRGECMLRWQAFERDPSPENRELLRTAYLAVPKHLRVYCGDMDSKDYPIRRALGLSFDSGE